MTGTKERPILFSGPMVRAILDGRKTQTRRVIKPQPGLYIDELHGNALRERAPYTLECYETGNIIGSGFQDDDRVYRCPFGVPGDRLWVREAFHAYHCDKPRAVYRADGEPCRVHKQIETYEVGQWTPSIHMPRWASRITLEITDVRVERVQDISEDDAIEEGVQDWCVEADPRTGEPIQVRLRPSEEFANLWDSINADRGLGWDVNPWVWVVEFKRINR